MVKSKSYAQMPVKGGVRRNRYGVSTTGTGDSTLMRYNTASVVFDIRNNNAQAPTTPTGNGGLARHYVPGYFTYLANAQGPNLVGSYSSAVFKPGTTIRWEPAVGYTVGGRITVGFTDNPEVISNIQSLLALAYADVSNQDKWNNYANAVRGLGSARSFPVWQETSIPFPTKLRRKRYDVNSIVSDLTDVNVLDRCNQMSMFAVMTGCTSTSGIAGVFQYRDVVDVEGIHNAAV